MSALTGPATSAATRSAHPEPALAERGEPAAATALPFLHALAAVTRSIRWGPLAAAGVVATAVVGWPHAHGTAVRLQVASILLSSAVGFALDDPATETLATSPTPLLRRRLLRLMPVALPVLLVWGSLLAWKTPGGRDETLALALLSAGLLGLSLAVGGVAGRARPGAAGIAVPPAILFLLFLSSAIPPRWRPLPLGDIPGGWIQIQLRWAGAAVLGGLVFLASSRDPAASAVGRTIRERLRG